MDPLFKLTPNKKAFVTYHFIVGRVVSLIILGILGLVANSYIPNAIVYFAGLYILWAVYSFFSLSIRFKKELYIFFPLTITAKAGGIVHNRETKLVIRNITHVTLVRPWLENKLFGTGRVIIELAGSARPEAVMNSMDNPEKIYEYIKTMMKANGFGLKKERLVQKEQPSIIGVLFETLGPLVFALFMLTIFGAWTIIAFIAVALGPIAGAILLLAVVFGIIGHFFIRFLDLMKRVYFIYNDTIVYEEGFLTKVDSFIPIENLADAELTQTLVDKIFGLYDVRVSCQGAGHEIKFKNLKNGPKMEENIDLLINQTTSLAGKRAKETVDKQVLKTKIQPGKTLPLTVEKEFQASYKMDMIRSLAPSGLFLLTFIIVGIVAAIFFGPGAISIAGFGFFAMFGIFGTAIKVSCTNYAIKSQGMQETYDFLNRRDVEFSNDKITGVIFVRNFIDEWFNTMSMKFWSIGAAHDINFANIKEDAGMREAVLAKFGITGKEQPIYTEASGFSLSEMLKANLPLVLIALIVFAGLVWAGITVSLVFFGLVALLAVVVLAAVVYQQYYYKTSKIFFYKHYVHFRVGIFFKHYYYALYDNVKDIKTTRYPWSSKGTIMFNVAGEGFQGQTQQQQTQGKKEGMLVPHHFTIAYMPGIKQKDELIDLIFYKRPSAEQAKALVANVSQIPEKNLMFAKPSLANSLLWTIVGLLAINIVLGIFLLLASPFGLVLLGILDIAALAFVILKVKAMSFAIQPYRVLAKFGILYKSQVTIVFTKIDHIRQFQGITHKMFGNGTIIVHTTGSSRPEISIRDIPNFKEFYATLEKYY